MQGKRIFAFVLLLAMTLSVFSGCDKEEQTSAGTVSDFESQTHFQVSAPAVESSSGDTSNAPVSGEFVVSDKKYAYNDANLVLLNVENKTDRHYNVTIKGKYLDENGETIKEEGQTFEAFPAGWSNHFIFYPRIAFDGFTFELETEAYVPDRLTSDSEGNPLASYMELSYEKTLQWRDGWGNDHGSLYFTAFMENHHPSVTIGSDFHVILLDANGEIYITDYEFIDNGTSGTQCTPVGGEDDGKNSTEIYLLEHSLEGREPIPETVQGKFTAIFAIATPWDMDVAAQRGLV